MLVSLSVAGLFAKIVQPGPAGQWGLDANTVPIGCPAVRECAVADPDATMAAWKTCDDVVRAYFWVVFAALASVDETLPVFPNSNFAESSSRCGVMEQSTSDFSSIQTFARTIAGEIRSPVNAQPTAKRKPIASKSGNKRPPIPSKPLVKPTAGANAAKIIAPKAKVASNKRDAGPRAKTIGNANAHSDVANAATRLRPGIARQTRLRIRSSAQHAAVLRALWSLDVIAQAETNAEIGKLDGSGAAHRSIARRLTFLTICYRRRLGELRFLENAWFVGRLRDRSEWRLRACTDRQLVI